jgi:hypothetical protein
LNYLAHNLTTSKLCHFLKYCHELPDSICPGKMA